MEQSVLFIRQQKYFQLLPHKAAKVHDIWWYVFSHPPMHAAHSTDTSLMSQDTVSCAPCLMLVVVLLTSWPCLLRTSLPFTEFRYVRLSQLKLLLNDFRHSAAQMETCPLLKMICLSYVTK